MKTKDQKEVDRNWSHYRDWVKAGKPIRLQTK